ncbi:MAG: hypothetical protein EU539_05265 [Promethearchaeota archaeon]|nr:MAG: hypothetical protein EU539_05265 [Candidatus Lokiarchaeota archaeon]
MGSASTVQKLLNLSKTELLNRAEKFIFSTGLNDGASKLCRENMKFGLAQFQLIQEKFGMEPKASFISSPDETISRNAFRWNSGLGYGGRLNWGDGNEKFIFINVKPNFCGILVGGLDEIPKVYDIIKNIDKIKETELYHDDILINWDYGISNHFINCFETKTLSDVKLPPYMFMIHGSAPEFRDDRYGIGLYVDKSNTLKERTTKVKTVFGTQHILLDSDAKEYMDFSLKALQFSNIKREIIATNLFGNEYKVICNQPHQFLKDYNNMYLGSNCTDIEHELIQANIFPTTLRADIAAYLFKGKKNFSETTLKNANFLERARDLELLDLLKNADVLPHGGGYSFPDIKKVKNVLEYKDQRYFECELKSTKERLKIIRDVTNLQFEYRGRDIVLKTLQLDLGEIIARLNPKFSLKV